MSSDRLQADPAVAAPTPPRRQAPAVASVRYAARAAPRSSPRRRDDAVSPIVGTLLVLAITVIGMTVVLLWGAPTIERLQLANAHTAMVGEFEDIRLSVEELSVPDIARAPNIRMSGGTLGIEEGTRFMASIVKTGSPADPTPLPQGCDMDVRGWGDGGSSLDVGVVYATCGDVTDNCTPPLTGSCLRVFQVFGDTTIERCPAVDGAGVATVYNRKESGGGCNTASGLVEFGAGDWLVSLTDAGVPQAHYAQAWLLSQDRIIWRQAAATGDRSVLIESSAIFSSIDGAYFLEKPPAVQEDVFGTGVYTLWFRAHDAQQVTEVSGQRTYQVYVGLSSIHGRVDSDVRAVRYHFAGDLAEAWCEALLLRDRFDDDGAYTAAQPCATGDADGIRSVRYQRNDGDDAGTDPDPFPFEFVHAIIRTGIQF